MLIELQFPGPQFAVDFLESSNIVGVKVLASQVIITWRGPTKLEDYSYMFETHHVTTAELHAWAKNFAYRVNQANRPQLAFQTTSVGRPYNVGPVEPVVSMRHGEVGTNGTSDVGQS